MGTPFNDIEDLALIIINDYKLDNLIRLNEDAFLKYLDGFLIKSVPKFTKCLQSLQYDKDLREFSSTLTLKEQDILSDILVETWFKKECNNTTQFNLHLNNKDFKTYSEANNIKEKSEYLDRIREKYGQDISDYEIENLSTMPFFGGN